MPKNLASLLYYLGIYWNNYLKNDLIEEITSKTSESESTGCTGKLKTSLTNISALGQLVR